MFCLACLAASHNNEHLYLKTLNIYNHRSFLKEIINHVRVITTCMYKSKVKKHSKVELQPNLKMLQPCMQANK